MLNFNNFNPNVLVLLDLKENSEQVLSMGAKLAQKLNGSISVLHVRTPLDAIGQDNQLSAKKEFYEHYESTKEQMEALIKKVSNVPSSVRYDLLYGNVRNNILEVIEQQRPDVVVLGKRIPKIGGLLGDRVTSTVLDSFKNAVFIADNTIEIKDFEDISAGMLHYDADDNKDIWKSLVENASKNVNYFGVVSQQTDENAMQKEGNRFLFPEGDGAMDNIVAYADKTNTNLFYIPKTALGSKGQFPRKMIQKLKANVLLS